MSSKRLCRGERALALGLALMLAACTGGTNAGECLPPARASSEPEEIEYEAEGVQGTQTLWWYCETPPPPELLDGQHRTDLVWVEGEQCDPCDRERIASVALTQVYQEADAPALRLLCGPIPWELQPWDRKGCVYAVASSPNVVY